MRAFLAIDLAASPDLQRIAGPIPGHFHLTLRFFADLPEEGTRVVGEVLQEVAGQSPSYVLELRSIGAFPSARDPRVVWVGLGQGREETVALADRLVAGLARSGIPPDARPFEPHATLMRVRGPRDRARALRMLEEGRDRSYGTEIVRRIVGYESRLTPAGAVHRPFVEAPLTGPESST